MSLHDNRCTQCGQAQTEGGVVAPMVHAATGIFSGQPVIDSYHLDCMPYDLEQQHRDRHGPRIDAAKAGVRGDELRAVDDVKVGK
jgi:hypothetical protein